MRLGGRKGTAETLDVCHLLLLVLQWLPSSHNLTRTELTSTWSVHYATADQYVSPMMQLLTTMC